MSSARCATSAASRGRRVGLAAALAVLALAGDASALGLSIGVSPGPLTPFRPGATATASGTLVVSSPLSGWTLEVRDGTVGTAAAGRLQRSALCSEGVPFLAQALEVTVTPSIGVATSAGAKTLGATNQLVASGPLTAATTVATSYRQVIGAAEQLLTGCTYSATVTYTVS